MWEIRINCSVIRQFMINDQFVHNDENKFLKDHTNWGKVSKKWSESMWAWKKEVVGD